MQLVSNYPNVPVATTNVATDSARVDNQQRPPLLPPQQLGKTYQERGLEQRQERATEQQQERQDRIQQRQSGQQQQQTREQQQGTERQLPRTEQAALAKLATKGGGLNRRDIRDRTQTTEATGKQMQGDSSHPFPNEAPRFYRQIGTIIKDTYQSTSTPRDLPRLELQA
ncbi:hypothetical protein L2725_15510 [Shewanella corallii]|uniref:Uncharacterized protein n=1 Tax=Shewanella corallii TaxID=560080 RepID=A0ABT0N9Z4_9GAMM|nr:hypothetical protein [Shewanella corallii]MCL2915167.1 hypothetical protein [Shewanella corallii]